MKKILLALLALQIFASSCGNKSHPAEQEEAAHHHANHEPEQGNTTSLTQDQIRTIGIELGSLEQKELTNAIKANGVLTVPNQNKAFVTPLYSGVVKSLHIQPGSFVKQGQVIATIQNPELIQIQQQLQQLKAQIALAEIELKRQQDLVAGNAAPMKRLQQVQTELANLKTQRNGIQQQLATIGASQSVSATVAVKAPIAGTVSQVMAQLGSNVAINAPIAEIVNNSQLHLDLFVYEKDLTKLRADQTIHFTITNNAGKEYDAKIFSIGTAFEAGSKTIPVHAKVIGNKAGLIDGMNVTALVSLDKSTVPAVPSEAIVNYQGRDYIFIVVDPPTAASTQHSHADEDGHSHATSGDHDHAHETETPQQTSVSYQRIPIAKGTTDVGYSEITPLSDLPAGTKIVTKGAYFLLAKMTNTGEHEH
ncbi:MAG: efflux RND transporter periplasmic adaptor subunit [Bacteroidetes bacterium]|nr:efflux RND transporter periplasmic adaptor subunit [Bacteroidota bacterium]